MKGKLLDFQWLQEQFFIMKPNELADRSFKLYPTTDQAAKYVCAGKFSWGPLQFSFVIMITKVAEHSALMHSYSEGL